MSNKKIQKTLWNKKKPKSYSCTPFPGLLLLLAVPSYFIYILGQELIRSRRLDSSGIIARALVIDDKNYWGNSPVSRTYSCSYSFEVEGKKYIGDTRTTECRPDQIVSIEYVPDCPRFNRMVKAN